MRVVFMGTPEFAVPCLERIVSDGHEVCGVFTQPDKPKGRKFELTPPPVKARALELGIPVFQPVTLRKKETADLLRSMEPDVIAVTTYGKILPPAVLRIPKHGCVNVHASLLPKYRGAAPIQWSIINGEKETGITTMFMAEGIDTGDMILKKSVSIGENETAGELHDRLMLLGSELLSQTFRLLEQGAAPREKQDDVLSCYAPMIDKSVGKIDWNKPAGQIHNLVRGLSPWPSAYTCRKGKTVKILETRLARGQCAAKPGEVVKVDENGIRICCGGGGTLILTQLQQEGGRRMCTPEYCCGHCILAGETLGE